MTMSGTADRNPFLFLSDSDWSEHAGRTDVLLIAMTKDVVQLPQFDIEIEVQGNTRADIEAALDRAIRQMLAFYEALYRVPADYINDVEQAQMAVLNEALAPWIMRQMAQDPDRFPMPPLCASDLVGA